MGGRGEPQDFVFNFVLCQTLFRTMFCNPHSVVYLHDATTNPPLTFLPPLQPPSNPPPKVPRQVLRELEKAMPEDAMVSTDIGNSCSVSNGYLRFKTPRSYLAAMTFGNCGYAFPAAMGAKVACPDRPAVAYVGDGAWGK